MPQRLSPPLPASSVTRALRWNQRGANQQLAANHDLGRIRALEPRIAEPMWTTDRERDALD
ncbi:MAG: hypothetical protein RLZ94_448 [Actinomycetota bacterium]